MYIYNNIIHADNIIHIFINMFFLNKQNTVLANTKCTVLLKNATKTRTNVFWGNE